MIVADAGVLVVALADDVDGDHARRRRRGELLLSPELVDLEVVSVLRRLVLAGSLPVRRAEQALADLVDLPLTRVGHRALLRRCWELRGDVTVYDAAYVAVAETVEAPLLTTDARLARAPGLRCDVEVLARRASPS